jgi:hypothetical protein
LHRRGPVLPHGARSGRQRRRHGRLEVRRPRSGTGLARLIRSVGSRVRRWQLHGATGVAAGANVRRTAGHRSAARRRATLDRATPVEANRAEGDRAESVVGFDTNGATVVAPVFPEEGGCLTAGQANRPQTQQGGSKDSVHGVKMAPLGSGANDPDHLPDGGRAPMF